MNFSLRALVTAAALGLLSPVLFGYGLEQTGPVQSPVSAMPSYGMAVPTRSALKTVVPQGWGLFIHKDAILPETMSWSVGDPWTRVLEDLSNLGSLSVLVDWERKHVLIRSQETAVQEAAVRAEINQAATTPLPKVKGTGPTGKLINKSKEGGVFAVNTTPAARSSTPAPTNTGTSVTTAPALTPAPSTREMELQKLQKEQAQQMAALPVVRTNPTTPMVKAQAAAAEKAPAKLVSTDAFSYSEALALNKPAARRVAQSIANKYKARLVWAAPELHLRGPVTLLARSAQEDVHLLQKALGAYSEVVVEYHPETQTVRALPRALLRQGVSAEYLQQLEQAAVAREKETGSAPASDESRLSLANGLNAVAQEVRPILGAFESDKKKPGPALMTLHVRAGEPLETAIMRFVRAQGFTFEWTVKGGFEASRATSFSGASIAEVLAQVLPPLGISADIYTRDKHVVVRLGEARDK